jgi:hypothetical protein
MPNIHKISLTGRNNWRKKLILQEIERLAEYPGNPRPSICWATAQYMKRYLDAKGYPTSEGHTYRILRQLMAMELIEEIPNPLASYRCWRRVNIMRNLVAKSQYHAILIVMWRQPDFKAKCRALDVTEKGFKEWIVNDFLPWVHEQPNCPRSPRALFIWAVNNYRKRYRQKVYNAQVRRGEWKEPANGQAFTERLELLKRYGKAKQWAWEVAQARAAGWIYGRPTDQARVQCWYKVRPPT